MVKVTASDSTRTAFESFDHLSRKFLNAKRQALYAVGKVVYVEIRKRIKEGPKTGEYYKYKGRAKQASAPGEYPANRSGNLRKSVGFTVESPQRMVVGAGANYGPFLDKGTRNMQPRPFVSRTALDLKTDTLVIMRKKLDEELKREAK